jgi:hypothetical protein
MTEAKNERNEGTSSRVRGALDAPDVSIVIINWKTETLLDGCLTSLIGSACGLSYEVFIIDNSPSHDEFNRLREKYSDRSSFFWLVNSTNIGGLAANQALTLSKGKYILLLGPDTVTLGCCLTELKRFLDEHPRAGAVSAFLCNPDGSPQMYYRRFWNLRMVFFLNTRLGAGIDWLFGHKLRDYYTYSNLNFHSATVVDQPAASCFMFRRESIGSGPIVGEEFPFYFNDVDLCKRIHLNGYEIYVEPRARAVHFIGSSFKKADTEWKRVEYFRSVLRYFEKYHKRQAPLVSFILTLDRPLILLFRTRKGG